MPLFVLQLPQRVRADASASEHGDANHGSQRKKAAGKVFAGAFAQGLSNTGPGVTPASCRASAGRGQIAIGADAMPIPISSPMERQAYAVDDACSGSGRRRVRHSSSFSTTHSP